MVTASLLAHLLWAAHFRRIRVHLLQQSLAVPAHIVVAVAFVRDMLRKDALEHRRERDEPGQALVRYVQLHRQCSEAAAYRRLAAFVEKHVPLGDYSFIETMLAQEKQRLLALAQELIVPDEIDEI